MAFHPQHQFGVDAIAQFVDASAFDGGHFNFHFQVAQHRERNRHDHDVSNDSLAIAGKMEGVLLALGAYFWASASGIRWLPPRTL